MILLIVIVQFLSISAINTTIEESSSTPINSSQAKSTSNTNNKSPVIFVGNNWQGTITVIDSQSYEVLGVINGIPDKIERLEAIKDSFTGRMFFWGIRKMVGEGNDQYVDDMYSSIDGQRLIVSRPSFADVVAISIVTGEIIWRFPVDGYRSDHMALSPDGKHVAVSASTADKVHVIDVQTGKEVGSFPSGDSPHENVYSKDGSKIFHASIGNVFTPFDIKGGGLFKGKRRFLVVDTKNYDIIESFDIKDKLDAAGLDDISPSIRPMAHTKDENTFYFQLSFLHGFVEYDMQQGIITRKADLPKVTTYSKTKYVNDSAHHGIAISGDDKQLCVAGTMDDYVAIVDTKSFGYTILEGLGEKPYWVVTDKQGEHCFVSWSGTDQLSVINFARAEEVKRIDVGDHPQRVREGYVPSGWNSRQSN